MIINFTDCNRAQILGLQGALIYRGLSGVFPLTITLSESVEYDISLSESTEYDIVLSEESEHDISLSKEGGGGA